MQTDNKVGDECADVTCMWMQKHRHRDIMKEIPKRLYIHAASTQDTEGILRLKKIILPVLQVTPYHCPDPLHNFGSSKIYSLTLLIPCCRTWITILVVMVERLWQIGHLAYSL